MSYTVLNLERIVGVADTENMASRRVMEKVGMKYQHNFDCHGHDRVYYSRLRETDQ
jgi:[ribosomal protein S5]-alanine N-acetyltransferase